jgi:tRNA 5-methylaminomethyl-2-thiouridine biosynthesis bifunctional protein
MSTPARALPADSGLADGWRAQPSWTILDTALASLEHFLNAWCKWQQAPMRPRVLHYVGVVQEHQLAELTARAHALCNSEPNWYPLWLEVAPLLNGLRSGQYRLLLQNGALSLTVCISPLADALAEQQVYADTVYLGPAEAPMDVWQLKALARCCRRGARMVAQGTDSLATGLLAETGFVDVASRQNQTFATFNPPWPTSVRDANASSDTPARCVIVGAGLAWHCAGGK